MFFHDEKWRTTFILVSFEGNSSSDMRAGKSYIDLDLSLGILLTYLLHGTESFLRRSFQLVKKFPAFYGTRRFITAFTSARHLSLS